MAISSFCTATGEESAPTADTDDRERSVEVPAEVPGSSDGTGNGASFGNLNTLDNGSDFPISSPIFEELATQEARQKRLDFLSSALSSVIQDSSQDAKEKSDIPSTKAPKKEMEQLHNDFSGYAELGMSNTAEDILEIPKLHPNRSFYPGTTYLPQVKYEN